MNKTLLKGKKFNLVRKGGYCYICGDTFDYLCDDCGHCRWCCTC
jgi:hypothetical protein